MSQPPVTQPKRYPVLGRLIKYTGILIMLAGVAVLFYATRDDSENWLLPLLSGFALIAGGAFNYLRGTRLASQSVVEARKKDTRAPIIFLRSFGDESADYSLAGFGKALKTAFKMQAATGVQPMISAWGPTFQIQLAKLLSDIGPYIAIGRPGEEVAGSGSAKTYVSNDGWERKVEDWLQEARLVILRPGSTSGVSTEFGMLTQWAKPRKILLIMPHTEKAYQGFRKVAQGVFPHTFPEKLPASHFMCFDQDWQPREIPQKVTLFDTLEPFFLQNGISKQDFSLRHTLF